MIFFFISPIKTKEKVERIQYAVNVMRGGCSLTCNFHLGVHLFNFIKILLFQPGDAGNKQNYANFEACVNQSE